MSVAAASSRKTAVTQNRSRLQGVRMKRKEKSDYIIQTVAHALDLLEQFHGDVSELGVTELSKRLHLHKNNVFRLLATLASRDYIAQNKYTGNYRLGLKNLELGQTVIKQMGLHRRAMQVLESLARECDETCYVASWNGSQIVYLDAVESSHPVRVVPRVGRMLPAYCTAAGKVLLAGVTDKARQHYLAGEEFRQHATKTISNRDNLLRELETITAEGYALEDEELDVGVRGIAAPIRDYTGGIVGAICVSGPLMRFDGVRMQEVLIPLVKRAAAEISRRLGYSLPSDITHQN